MSNLDTDGGIVPTHGDDRTASEVLREPLNSTERKVLEKLEQEIDEALFSFVEIGLALSAIRDKRLYRQHYANFDDYCLERWGFSRQRASQLINAARLADRLSTIVDTPPTNENQIRPLIGRSDEDAVKAWKLAEKLSGSKPITGRLVEECVKTIRGDSGVTAKSGSDESTTGVEQARDAVGSGTLNIDAAIPPEQTASDNASSTPFTSPLAPTAKVSGNTDVQSKGGEAIENIEPELDEQTTEESFELADGTRSVPMPFSESEDVITAEAVAGKLRQMAENNSSAGADHRKKDSVIAGQQAGLLELVATVNRVVSSPSTHCGPEQIYWAVDELLHLVAHLRTTGHPV